MRGTKLFALAVTVGILSVIAHNGAAAATPIQKAGPITALDLAGRRVEIALADGSQVWVKVRPGTNLRRNGEPVGFKRLTLLDTARVRFRSKDHVALRLISRGPASVALSGLAGAIEFGSGKVTVGNRTIKTSAATRIARNGEPVSLSEVTREDRLLAHLLPGTAAALDLICDGPENDEVHGTIVSVGDGSLVVAPENGTPNLVLTIGAETEIEIDGSPAAVSALQSGQSVEVHYNPDTLVAFAVEADGPDEPEDEHVHGSVVAVDVAGSTLTVQPDEGGAPIVFQIAPATEIEVNGDDAGLDALEVGMPVEVEFDPATLVASEVKAGEGEGDDGEDEKAKVVGIIEAVDLTASTLTLAVGSAEAALVLKVTPETEIEIDGEPGALGDLLIGAEVKVVYFTTTLEAKEIEVEEEDDDGEESEVDGTVVAVDAAASTITIQPAAESAGSPITLTVGDETEIKVGDDPGSLEDIEVGQSIHAHYDPETLIATEIEVEGEDDDDEEEAEVNGTVVSVDVAASTITIQPAAESYGSPITLTVGDETEIKIGDDPASLEDIEVGQSIHAHYDPETLIATEIEVEGEDDDDEEEAEVNGSVVSVDVAASTITIQPAAESYGSPITLTVGDETEIKIGDDPASLEDIEVGQSIHAHYDPETLMATEIEVEGEDDEKEEAEVNGTVVAADTGASTITIQPFAESGGSITLTVGEETEIKVGDDPGSFEDIEVGQSIHAHYDPDTLIATEIEVDEDDDGGEESSVIEGTVVEVDSSTSTITIAPFAESGPITLTVTEETEITVGGESASLGDIEVGAEVRAEYDADSLEACEIEVGGGDEEG